MNFLHNFKTRSHLKFQVNFKNFKKIVLGRILIILFKKINQMIKIIRLFKFKNNNRGNVIKKKKNLAVNN